MASSMTDFLQTFLNLKQVQNQTEQIAQRARSEAVSGLTTFMELAKHTADPGARQALVQRFSDLGVADAGQLSAIQYNVAPSIEAQKELMTRTGIDMAAGRTPEGQTAETGKLAQDVTNLTMTGQTGAQRASSTFLEDVFQKIPSGHKDFMDKLAVGLATRTAAGQDAGEFTLSAAAAALPPNVQSQHARIAGKSALSAYEAGSLALGGSQLKEQARANSLDAAYKAGMLGVDQARAFNTGNTEAEGQKIKLLDSKVSLLAALTAAKQKDPTDPAIVGFIGALNGLNAQLRALGVPEEGNLDYNPDELMNPGMFSRNTSRGQQRPAPTKP